MPVNAGPEYFAAEQQYHDAKTDEAQLAGLQEMLRTVPKHKSSEGVVAEITQKIGKLKRSMEKKHEAEKMRAKKSGVSVGIKKEGAGQIALVGLTNSGKTTLFNYLTGLKAEVGTYDFTTVEPMAGMMNYENANIQIVDLPAVVEGSHEGKFNGTQLLSIIRNADALCISVQSLDEFKIIQSELELTGIIFSEQKPNISYSSNAFGGLQLAGKEFLNVSEETAIKFLYDLGYTNINVVLMEPATLQKLVRALDSRIVYKKALVLTRTDKTKTDIENFLLKQAREKLKQELLENIKQEIEKKLRAKLWEETKIEVMQSFEAEVNREFDREVKSFMKGAQKRALKDKIATDLAQKMKARIDSMTENKMKEALEKEAEKVFKEESLRLVSMENIGIKIKVLNKELLPTLKSNLFEILDIVLVFTKPPGKDPDYKDPMVVKKGSTVQEVVVSVHKDLAKSLRSVRLWGSSKFPGQMVSKDYILQNKDVIEISG